MEESTVGKNINVETVIDLKRILDELPDDYLIRIPATKNNMELGKINRLTVYKDLKLVTLWYDFEPKLNLLG